MKQRIQKFAEKQFKRLPRPHPDRLKKALVGYWLVSFAGYWLMSDFLSGVGLISSGILLLVLVFQKPKIHTRTKEVDKSPKQQDIVKQVNELLEKVKVARLVTNDGNKIALTTFDGDVFTFDGRALNKDNKTKVTISRNGRAPLPEPPPEAVDNGR